VSKEDLSLQIDKDTLQIYGKVPQLSQDAEPRYGEFAFKDYYRAFTIGEEIDRDKITASVNNGVLKLVLPKAERAKPRKIDISFS
jgi:HSP20 family molecular chaperone IbpA